MKTDKRHCSSMHLLRSREEFQNAITGNAT